MDDHEKQRIVDALNRLFGTTVPVAVVEIAVASEMITWEALQVEADDDDEGSTPMR